MFLQVDFIRLLLCSSAKELKQNSNASSREEYIIYSTNIVCFIMDSSRLHSLWFFLFCLW